MIKRLVFILTLMTNLIFANEIRIDGLIESYHSFRIDEEGEIIGQRNRARVNFRKKDDNLYALVSLRARQNPIIGQGGTRVELYESYLEYFTTNWDLKIGRQIFSWGKADGIRITDALSPVDYQEFLTRDFDEIRMPVTAFKFHYLFVMSDLEIVWIPQFSPALLPLSPENPWFMDQKENTALPVAHPLEPTLSLKNSEAALKYSMFLNGIDFSLSTAYLWDDFPVMTLSENEIVPRYKRLWINGACLSKPVGQFVIRLEGAFIDGRYFQTKTGQRSSEKQSAKYLMGLDWYSGNKLTISTQLANEQFIFDYEEGLIDNQNNYLATLNIRKKMFREKLKLENRFYFGFSEQDVFARINIDYAITDNLHMACGIDYFSGNKGFFGNYDQNDSFWLKARYNF